MFTIQHSINFARPYIEYAPCNAGNGGEPATSVASMIRNTFLNAPMTWNWNRNSLMFSTVQGQQDYPVVVADFGFMENWTLTATASSAGVQVGKIFQGQDSYNTSALSPSSDQQRSDALSVQSVFTTPALSITITQVAVDSNNNLTISTSNTQGVAVGQSVTFSGVGTATFLNGQTVVVTAVVTNVSFTAKFTHASYGPTADTGTGAVPVTNWVSFRFMGVPNQTWTVTVTYQKRSPQFGPYFITDAQNHSGSNTTYDGSFDPLSFPVGSTAQITGFVTNAVNNGSFTVVSCSTTQLVVANNVGVAETVAAYAINPSWSPVPDQYNDIYNNLFLSEMFSQVNEFQTAQFYRQRGIAAFLAKATGLTETQKKAFIQQWLARQVEEQSTIFIADQGNRGRGV